jgi:hypothetical protein
MIQAQEMKGGCECVCVYVFKSQLSAARGVLLNSYNETIYNADCWKAETGKLFNRELSDCSQEPTGCITMRESRVKMLHMFNVTKNAKFVSARN